MHSISLYLSSYPYIFLYLYLVLGYQAISLKYVQKYFKILPSFSKTFQCHLRYMLMEAYPVSVIKLQHCEGLQHMVDCLVSKLI